MKINARARWIVIGMLFMSLLSAGCASLTSRPCRIYNLATGDMTEARFAYAVANQGKMTMTGKDGEKFKGEYTTVANDQPVTFNLTKIGTTSATTQNGNAILVGDRGTTLDMQYVVDKSTNHGYGEGKDNKGNKYRIQF